MLRPGVQVVRRGRDRLQVGLAAARCVVRRTPANEAALAALGGGQRIRDLPLLETLDSHGLLARPVRSPVRLRVVGTLGAPLPEVPSGSGVRLHHQDPTHLLVLSRGELDRATLTEPLREGTPHLIVRAVDDSVIVGPYVEPGLTACLQCIDLHQGDDDPELADVITRYVRLSADTLPEPLLGALALNWALTDLVGIAHGVRPSSWSSTLTFSPSLREAQTRTWLRHPACGCAWSGTLEE